MDAASAYERGFCKDCEAKIQPYGPSSRCVDCDAKRKAYEDSLWGLDETIKERTRNEILGLCFHCGDGLTDRSGDYKRLCMTCSVRSEQGRWFKEMIRKGGKPIEENPYKTALDSNEMDHSVNLTPTRATMANRMFVKARYFRVRAQRGGPRGREYEKEAATYQGIGERMMELHIKAGQLK